MVDTQLKAKILISTLLTAEVYDLGIEVIAEVLSNPHLDTMTGEEFRVVCVASLREWVK